ncbi:hypothetical protein C8J57DRAFT_1730397 [Mycena rebaudengoi]|nr:hypothetical protein C8J57DRAFT_1730397 [Mycena rebaudengoi]
MSLRQPRRAPHRLNRVDQTTARARAPRHAIRSHTAPPQWQDARGQQGVDRKGRRHIQSARKAQYYQQLPPPRLKWHRTTKPSLSIDLKGSPSAGAPPGDLLWLVLALHTLAPEQHHTRRSAHARQRHHRAGGAGAQHVHAGIANPRFWQGLRAYLGTSLPPADAQLAFEEFLRAAKGTLTASEIARLGPQPSPSVEAPPGDLPSSSGSSSPSTRSRQNSTTRDITLTLDNATPVLAEQEHSTYHAGIANPSSGRVCSRIWGATSLPPADAQLAFEEFLRAAKGTLTASEIVRARDQAGVTDLGGF